VVKGITMSLSKKNLSLWSIAIAVIFGGIGLITIRSNHRAIDIDQGSSAAPASSVATFSLPTLPPDQQLQENTASRLPLQERVQVTTQPPKNRPTPTGKVASARVSAQFAEQLPIESEFVASSNLKIVAIDKMLSEENFDETFNNFEEQMFRDPLATELGTAYNEEISKKLLEDQTGSRLTKIACGLKVCLGSVQSPIGADLNTWIKSFQNNPETPYSSVVFLPSKESPSGTVTRFLFSNDPNINGGTLPQNTPIPISSAGTILPTPATPVGG
jgi:hypothetical protein